MAGPVKKRSRSGEPGRTFAARKGSRQRSCSTGSSGSSAGMGAGGSERIGLVPVRVVGRGQWGVAEGLLEIVLDSGERVRMSEEVSEETLRRAIRVLRERC